MKIGKKLLAVIMAVILTVCASQPAFAAGKGTKTGSLAFSVVSDIHYYPQSMMGSKTDDWYLCCRRDAKEYNEADGILDAALTAIGENAKKEGTKYVLIPGDLTRNSEYNAHAELAKKLEAFEKKYGVQVFVINGNHDINVNDAATFENDVEEPARCITAAEFKEVYKNLGYDLAFDEFKPAADDSHGMLSYAANLGDDYCLIAVDSCKYDPDSPQKAQTDGCISDEQMDWILEKTEQAKAAGRTPVMMIHHSLAAHMKVEPSITFAFVLDDYVEAAEKIADAGVHYAFTGHLHTNDIASTVSDNGSVIYDCETPSLTGFPNQYRNVTLETYSNGETYASYENVDADSVVPITVDDTTYPMNSFKYTSFGLCFGGGLKEGGTADVTDFLLNMAVQYVGKFGREIQKTGSALEWLKNDMGVDLESIISGFLEPYIGDGIGIGNIELFSADNIMWFIEDLLDQIVTLYMEDPENLADAVRPALEKIVNLQVSDVPCTKFLKDYGFGDASKGGTFGDAVLSAMIYWYLGNETIDDDAFIKDVIDNFENGDAAFNLYDVLVDVLFNDLVDGVILSKLEIRLDKLFGESPIGRRLGKGVNNILCPLLRGDFTYMNLVNTVFGLGVLPYTSLYDVVDKLLIQEYLTDSQIESVGHVLAYILEDFSTDSNPCVFGDSDITYSSADVAVEATRENYRIPTMVSVTMGDDSTTSATINWFSKYSLDTADIEIYEASKAPAAFTGKATKSADFTIKTESKLVERYFPGIDIGIIGIIKYYFDMYQHTVSLTNLKPGTKYVYRVGNEKYGWWSEAGTVETSSGSGNVTFFHMSDPQSQNEKQYTEAWANTVKTAFDLYPEAKFIMNTGDLVDCGMNNHQWQWMFDTASDNLMSTYLMPATGNHEEKDDYSTVSNFVLPNMPEQDTTTGVYYSYTYNDVHIAVLNTNNLGEDDALNNEQIEWLRNDMNSSSAQWKVLAFHKALYSNGSHYDDDDVCAMRDQLCSLIPELDIDLVLQGHDHVYMRTFSLDGNEVVEEKKISLEYDNQVYDTYVDPTGASYVIDGCSGVKTYIVKDTEETDKLFPRAAKVKEADSQIFSAIQIVDGVLYFNAYKVSGDEYECIDKFAIQKNGAGTQTDKTPDILPDEQTETKNCFMVKVWNVIKKIFTVAWNIFRMYVIEYTCKKCS